MAKKKVTGQVIDFPTPPSPPERLIPASMVDHIVGELVRHFRQSEEEMLVAYRQREGRLLATFVATQVKIRELGG